MPAESASEPASIAGLARALRAGAVTAEALTDQCLATIAERNPSLNAFISVFEQDAREQARRADTELDAKHDRGPLHGIPVSLKDLIDVAGTTTTAGSRVRAGHIAAADAPIVGRLRDAGAVLIGKTNLHEFALGTTNEDSAFGPARHPRDPSRIPGGSSGGSAVSVDTGMAHASVGTDTGGSIRIPAAICGLVGLKPSYGEIPTDGVVPLSQTLDHVGPICRSVADAALVFDVLRGHPTSEPPRPRPVSGLRLGLLRDYFMAALDPQVAAAFEQACVRLTDAGVTIEEVSIPNAGDISPIYAHLVLAEAAAYHGKTLDSRAEDYTPNVRIRLEMGRYVLAEDYVRALRGRTVLTGEVDAVLKGRDGLLLPTVAIPATKIGAATVKLAGTEEPIRNVMLRLTQLFNITGHPAISLPCGTTLEGLPIGAQLVGATHRTTELLQLAAGLEPYLGPGASR
jgi:aspartyl-tRNA(Asn)/glutamyl-tRNA(Gln) amidotransferase subunit A